MNKLQSSWNWVKNHIEAINFGVVLFVIVFITWFSVHTLNVETELRNDKEFLTESLMRSEQTLRDAIRHINEQERVIGVQDTAIKGQSEAIKKLLDRIEYLTALLNGEYT